MNSHQKAHRRFGRTHSFLTSVLMGLALVCAVVFTVVFTVVCGFSSGASAFTRSEDELLQADVTEAKARAIDFRAHQARSAKADRDRERFANEIKAVRQKFEREQEQARKNYVKQRPSPEVAEARDAKLEQEFELLRLGDERRMDESRKLYLKKRARVERVIENEAHIDQNAEFGL